MYFYFQYLQICKSVAKKRFGENQGESGFLTRPLSLIEEDDFGPKYGVAISYIIELLHNLSLEGQNSKIVQDAAEATKLAELLIHPCLNVRMEAIRLFSVLMQVRKVTE